MNKLFGSVPTVPLSEYKVTEPEKIITLKKTKTMYFNHPEDIFYKVSGIVAIHDDLAVKKIELHHT